MSRFSTFFLISLSILIAACENEPPAKGTTNGSDPNNQNGSDSDSSSDDLGDTNLVDTENMPAGCGDGELSDDEACDDSNNKNGDGCKGDCLAVEDGWSCNPPGKPCHQIAICGDGTVLLPELCDDGNTETGDGCNDICQVEIGWACNESPSECYETTCGDMKMEGAESCDDGNTQPFDGCSPTCQKEPDCSAGACKSECGDGLVLGADEQCDDGNKINGDGCSNTCQFEEGYDCVQEGCENDDDCSLTVSVLYRDFAESHTDFGGECDGLEPNMVQDTLGSDWKPVSTGDGCDVSGFSDWYTTEPTLVDTITLYPDGKGNFVNRYGENGEPWEYVGTPVTSKCADGPDIIKATDLPNMCIDDCDGLQHYELQECEKVQQARIDYPDYQCMSPCPANGSGYAGTCFVGESPDCSECPAFGEDDFICLNPCANNGNGYKPEDLCQTATPRVQYDGNPLFFPLDDFGPHDPAMVPDKYGYGWTWEEDVLGTGPDHNFYFTSEITYWFAFDENKPATLTFTGDDDVWMFINGQLAVDLGGVHIPETDSVTISKTNNYGMEHGNVYRINVFQAERKMESSSFQLTLGGFNTARSRCTAECGDEVISLGEQCDDGVNDGGYGECGEGCKLDEYCGDGIVQEDHEHCDDGNFVNDDKCPNSCRNIVID